MRSINVNREIDESKFNRFQGVILFWCSIVIIFDGFDLVLYGTVMPVLMTEWSLNPIQAGAIGSYALVGMMFGALIFGTLADRFGRKSVILFCVTLFSLFTGLCGLAMGPSEFGIYRFIEV